MSNNQRTLYLDMDGVVADWRANAVRVIGYDCFDPAQRYSDVDWALLRSDPHIFLNLPLMDQAIRLVDLARKFRDDLGWQLLFLTAIPHNNDVPWTFHDKMVWANKYFPDIPVHFGPYSEDKYKHLRLPLDILVDDRYDNCEQWRAAGGIAVKVGLTLDTAIAELTDIYSAELAIVEHAVNTRRLIVEVL